MRAPLPPSSITIRALANPARNPRTAIPYEDLIDVVVVTKHWYAGQGDPIYALTSSVMAGKDVPIFVAEAAMANLERAASEVARSRRPGWERDVQRLGMAISDLEYRIYEARERAKALPNPLSARARGNVDAVFDLIVLPTLAVVGIASAVAYGFSKLTTRG